MASAPLSTLADRLGLEAADLSALKVCTAAQVRRLDATVEQTLSREDEAVESGLHAALQALPRPLRGRARTLLFPEADR